MVHHAATPPRPPSGTERSANRPPALHLRPHFFVFLRSWLSGCPEGLAWQEHGEHTPCWTHPSPVKHAGAHIWRVSQKVQILKCMCFGICPLWWLPCYKKYIYTCNMCISESAGPTMVHFARIVPLRTDPVLGPYALCWLRWCWCIPMGGAWSNGAAEGVHSGGILRRLEWRWGCCELRVRSIPQYWLDCNRFPEICPY